MPDQFDPDPLLLPGKSPADPAQAAGFLGGQAANFLGVPEAVQALRGQMTPEEAQQFALLAGMSMVPGMRGEGVATRALARTAQEGLNPYIYEHWLPYVKGYKNLERTVGESSPWKPLGENSSGHQYFPESIKTEGVPDYLPTPIPERATAAGFNVPLAHGTKASPFTEFKLPEELKRFGTPSAEIGIHAGSPKAANKFGGAYLSSYDSNRIYPLVMRAQNPLETGDLGNWGPRNIAGYLENHPEFGSDEISKALGGQDPADIRGEGAVEQIQALRDLIRSKGYDSIKYQNNVEDPGHTSYIALDPKQLRSPWAAFKDLDSRNLLAGLAGGAVAAPALSPNVQDYVKALNK
jgi:hypothetical protein